MSNTTGYKFSLNELAFHVSESPTSQDRVFALILDDAGSEYTEAQVRKLLGLPKSTVHAALTTLVQEQLIGVRNVGRTKLYWVEPSDPLIKMLKIARAIRKARAALEPVRERIDLAILYGSASRGEDRAGSDVDVLVVTDEKDAVLEVLVEHQWLQPVVLTSAEHMQLIAQASTFAGEVARGITL